MRRGRPCDRCEYPLWTERAPHGEVFVCERCLLAGYDSAEGGSVVITIYTESPPWNGPLYRAFND